MSAVKNPLGRLILMGSEGVEAASAPLWPDLLNGISGRIDLFEIPAAKTSLVFQSRISLLEKIISENGLTPRRATQIDADPPFDLPRPLIISAENIPDYAGDSTMCHSLKSVVTTRLLSMFTVIAGATAAAGMGSFVLKPVRPLPADPDNAQLEISDGLGMPSPAIFLPYFDTLPEPARQKILGLLPPGVLAIGIDTTSALSLTHETAYPIGLGKVTLMRDNELIWAGASGDIVPNDLISL